MKKINLCDTCALCEKGICSCSTSDIFGCNAYKEICAYYFNVYVWRKQEQEKKAEIERRKEIAKKNRERELSHKPFQVLRGILI